MTSQRGRSRPSRLVRYYFLFRTEYTRIPLGIIYNSTRNIILFRTEYFFIPRGIIKKTLPVAEVATGKVGKGRSYGVAGDNKKGDWDKSFLNIFIFQILSEIEE